MHSLTPLRNERGFSLIELLVASVVTMVVLGGAVALTSQIQNGYRRQLEDSAAEQEARYALDWIGRYIRSADHNPFTQALSECPVAGTAVAGVQMNPDGDAEDDDIRLMTDANPPDGYFGGTAATGCQQAHEDVTISLDEETNTIVFLDNNTGGAVSTRTDTVIEDLNFVYRDSGRAITANAASVFYIEIQITVRTRTIDVASGQPMTRTLTSEVRLRSRT
ncbi:MAG TPA: prepilin-type N-terminal cleavage/methylation domain-containing protein [Vicinamibacterales bacterium]|nr:prepilin-type N-terminal cleavage/methylation domain-containing protein [Vicinamibacterales bacterium]